MNKTKNNKSKFKFLILTIVAVSFSCGVIQSSRAMKESKNINDTKIENAGAQIYNSSNDVVATSDSEKTKASVNDTKNIAENVDVAYDKFKNIDNENNYSSLKTEQEGTSSVNAENFEQNNKIKNADNNILNLNDQTKQNQDNENVVVENSYEYSFFENNLSNENYLTQDDIILANKVYNKFLQYNNGNILYNDSNKKLIETINEYVDYFVVLPLEWLLRYSNKYVKSDGSFSPNFLRELKRSVNLSNHLTGVQAGSYLLDAYNACFKCLAKTNLAVKNNVAYCIKFITEIGTAAYGAYNRTVKTILNKINLDFIKNVIVNFKLDFIGEYNNIDLSQISLPELYYNSKSYRLKYLDVINRILVKALEDEGVKIGDPLVWDANLRIYFNSPSVPTFDLATTNENVNLNLPKFDEFFANFVISNNVKGIKNKDENYEALKEEFNNCFSYLYEVMLLHINHAFSIEFNNSIINDDRKLKIFQEMFGNEIN